MSSNNVLKRVALRLQQAKSEYGDYSDWTSSELDDAAIDVVDIIKNNPELESGALENEIMEIGIMHDDAVYFADPAFRGDMMKAPEMYYENAPAEEGIDMSDPLADEGPKGPATMEELVGAMKPTRNVVEAQKVFDSISKDHKITEAQMKRVYKRTFQRHLNKIPYPETEEEIPALIKKHAENFHKFVEPRSSKNRSKVSKNLMASSGPPPKENRDVSALQHNNFNKFPLGRYRQRHKRPTVREYNPIVGRDWIQTIAWKSKKAGPKNYGVLCNAAALWLNNNIDPSSSPTTIQHMLDTAAVWYGPYDDSTVKKPSNVLIQDYLPQQKTLNFGTYKLRTVADLAGIADKFKRNKPIYKAAMLYIQTGEGDFNKIRNSLGEVFVKTSVKQMMVEDEDEIAAVSNFEMINKYFKEHGLMQHVKLVAYLAAIWEAKTLTQVASISLIYFSEGIPSFLLSPFIEMSHITLQAGEDVEFSAWNFVSTLAVEYGSRIWAAICALSAYVIGSDLLKQDWATVIGFSPSLFAQSVKGHCLKTSAKSVGESILASLVFFTTRVLRCIETKSLTPLLEFGSDPTDWKFEAQAVRNFSSELIIQSGASSDQIKRLTVLRDSGQIPDFMVSPFTVAAFADYIDNLVTRGREIRKAWKDSPIARDIDYEMEHLFTFQKQNSYGYGTMSMRVEPFGISLAGPPGSGKSNLTDDLFHVLGRANSLPTDPSYRYGWQMNVNFQDGLTQKQWYYVGDDIDVSVAKPALGQLDHVGVTLKVVNNSAFPIESPHLATKGTNKGAPLAWVICSNNLHGRLQGYTLDPKAFFRRFPIWVIVKAKEAYSTNGKLDTSKIIAGPRDGEYYDLQVYDYSGESTEDFPYTLNQSVTTRSGLFKYIVMKYAKHMDNQNYLLTRHVSSRHCHLCWSTLDENGKGCSCTPQSHGQLLAAITGVSSLYLIYRLQNLFFRGPYQVVANRLSQLADKVDQTLELMNGNLLTANNFSKCIAEKMTYLPSPKIVAAVGIALFAFKMLQRFYMTKQGRVMNAVPGFVPSGWVRPSQDFTPGVPITPATWGYDDLVDKCRENIVLLYSVSGKFLSHGLCISTLCVLVPRHILVAGGTLIVSHKGVRHSVIINEFTKVDFGSDQSLVRVGGLVATGVYKYFWNTIDTSISNFDDVHVVTPDNMYIAESVKNVFTLPSCYSVGIDYKTNAGDCGLPYLGRVNTQWKIVAVHNSLNDVNNHGIGECVTQLLMDPPISAISVTKQGITMPFEQLSVGKRIHFTHYPAKSEVWSARHFYGTEAYDIGTANPPVHGNTFKTSVHPTSFAEDFRHYEEEWCGKKHYWTTPAMKGEMRVVDGEEKWVSPYSHSLVQLNRGPRHEDYMWLALADFLSPIDSTYNEGYSTLTLNQAIVGVPDSPIQSVDLSTSMGMPHNKKKKNFIIMSDGKAWVDPQGFTTIYEEMRGALAEGYILCPIALGILKDEQVSDEKRQLLKTRVFNCLPFPFNSILKMDLSPITVFLRNNPMLFECMVGINMTSSECNKVIECLDRVGPDEGRNVDCDIVGQDKSMDGVKLYFVSKAYQAIAWSLGLDGNAVFSLIQSCRCCVFVYKNDFFILGASNPSGGDQTVQINSIDNSISHRYFYYRMKYPDGIPDVVRDLLIIYMRTFIALRAQLPEGLKTFLDFRTFCGLVTYGDDSLLRVSARASFYDPSKISPLAKEFGMVYTDGGKKPTIGWKSMSDVVFLKRTFVDLPGIPKKVARLSLKTIAKMLVLAKKSTLTNFDQSVALVSDALREMVYHGEEMYKSFYAYCLSIAELRGFMACPYFRHAPYAVHHELMLAGAFSAYVDREVVQNLCDDE